MRKRKRAFFMGMAAWAVLGFSRVTLAHGFAGDRFFPPTITTDDPFAADELAQPGNPGGRRGI